jgi:hypothetical protein
MLIFIGNLMQYDFLIDLKIIDVIGRRTFIVRTAIQMKNYRPIGKKDPRIDLIKEE